MRISHNLSFRIIVVLGIIPACSSTGPSPVKKKIMPDLYYVHYAEADSGRATDASIAAALELYAIDPEALGDPLGIVQFDSAASQLTPSKRVIGLVLNDPDWVVPDTALSKEKIPGGTALYMRCSNGMRSLDSCWSVIQEFADSSGYEYFPPGIELYRGFGDESPETSVDLIIRIK